MARRLALGFTVHFVGKPASGPIAEAIEDYALRIGRTCACSLVCHPSRETPVLEGRRLLEKIGGVPFVALDPRGKRSTSEAFLALCAEAQLSRDHLLCFVIGGASGLAEPVLHAARRTVSLSDLTHSHDLARLVLLEQIYRAVATMTGSPYAR